jgi:hypothetical protein
LVRDIIHLTNSIGLGAAKRFFNSFPRPF